MKFLKLLALNIFNAVIICVCMVGVIKVAVYVHSVVVIEQWLAVFVFLWRVMFEKHIIIIYF